jgi:hypothetical protein
MTLSTLVAAALMVVSVPAFAVPEFLQYQGRLTDAAGEPLTAPVDVTFAIYAEDEDGEPLWTQTFTALALDHGRFSVLLGGEDAPFTESLLDRIAEGEELFLGIRVGVDPEMTPRQPMASVAYALHAGSASVGEAEHAATADTAEFAEEAEHAATADSAEFAEEAEHAATADQVEGMPGLAFQALHRVEVEPGASLSVVSVTIETPADGYVLVSAGGTLVLDNTGAGGARSHANVGEEEDGVPELTMGLVICDLTAQDVAKLHYVPFHSQRVYQKPAGEHTFHLNVRNNYDDQGTVAVNRPSITAVFVPNGYGTAEIQPPTSPDFGTR